MVWLWSGNLFMYILLIYNPNTTLMDEESPLVSISSIKTWVLLDDPKFTFQINNPDNSEYYYFIETKPEIKKLENFFIFVPAISPGCFVVDIFIFTNV